MTYDPCQTLEHEFQQAAVEFFQAEVVVKKLDELIVSSMRDIKTSLEDQKQRRKATIKLDSTRKTLSRINQELVKCREENPNRNIS